MCAGLDLIHSMFGHWHRCPRYCSLVNSPLISLTIGAGRKAEGIQLVIKFEGHGKGNQHRVDMVRDKSVFE